jgi:hypothetical protein
LLRRQPDHALLHLVHTAGEDMAGNGQRKQYLLFLAFVVLLVIIVWFMFSALYHTRGRRSPAITNQSSMIATQPFLTAA